MKKAFLSVALAILTLTCAITFSSCHEKVILPSSAITLAMALQPDGSVRQEIDFSLQTENMQKAGVSNDLQVEVKNNFFSSLEMLRNEFYLSFLLVYSLAPKPEFAIAQNIAVGQVTYDKTIDMIGFVIVYKNLQAYQYFQSGGQGDNQQEGILGKNNIEFVTRKKSEGAFPFAAAYTDRVGRQSTVGERYQSIYKGCYNATLPNSVVAKLDTPDFVYDYALPYSNVRTNADMVLKEGALYHNVWIKNLDNFKSDTIRLTVTTVNSGLWYLTLLVCAIFVTGVALLIIKLKNAKKLLKK